VYDVFLDDDFVKQVTVYDVGFGAADVVFSDLRTNPDPAKMYSKFQIMFNVTHLGDSSFDCYYRLMVMPENGGRGLSIPMYSSFDGAETVSQWYDIKREDNSKLNVVIWYKGMRILEDVVEVEVSFGDEIEIEVDDPNNISIYAIFVVLIVTAFVTIRNSARARILQ
jgi:hypothetical protein